MIIQNVFVSNNIKHESSGITDFNSMVPVIEYLSSIMPEDSIMSANISYDDADVNYKEIDVAIGKIHDRLVVSISKNKVLLPHPDVSFVPLVVDGEPELKVAIAPEKMEMIGMDKLQAYYESHLEIIQVILGHFAWFAELNSKDELKEFIEENRVYH